MFSFFKRSKKRAEEEELLTHAPKDFSFLGCDMHSHLIPGIDDGAPALEDSLAMIRRFSEQGYRKLITTPHVQMEFYDNDRRKITEHFAALKEAVSTAGIDIALEGAAEYYLDNYFLSGVLPDGLLTFGDKYVLVEVSMAGWPRNLSDMIFAIQSAGYQPILAHPERYLYEEDITVLQRLKDNGVLMQMNIMSLLGYYGGGVKALAEGYMAQRLYDFCGSDAHHLRHVQLLNHFLVKHPHLGARLALYGFRNYSLIAGG